MSDDLHSAAGPALGYLYQTQWPLIALVTRIRDEPDCQLVLEMADDIVWMDDGTPKELVQSKYHLNSVAGLGDMSVDLWRTIGVWLDTPESDNIQGPTFTLVTTAVSAPDSAARALSHVGRDAKRAQECLQIAASMSTSAATTVARAAFLALSPTSQASFVNRIYVVDGSPQIDKLDFYLTKELGMVVPLGHEATFIGLVWDWWIRRAIGLLMRKSPYVSGLELRGAIDNIRDQFTENNLPTLVPLDAFDDSTIGSYDAYVFVHQLNFVEPPELIIRKAIQDYYRAVCQSARWIEDNLVVLAEVQHFQADLKDEWERAFAWTLIRLPPDATTQDKVIAGRELLERCTSRTDVHIRDAYREPFYFRGKLHQLADEQLIGWHPDYSSLLNDLLASTS